MDNLARHYRGRFQQAQEFAKEGTEQGYQAALDICYELRLRPDLGLFRRVTVNLLLASLSTTRQQVYKFAKEALDVLSILKRELEEKGQAKDEIDTKYLNIQRTAESMLEAIKDPGVLDGDLHTEEEVEDRMKPNTPQSQQAFFSSSLQGFQVEVYLTANLAAQYTPDPLTEESSDSSVERSVSDQSLALTTLALPEK